jgi:hypothetical protein
MSDQNDSLDMDVDETFSRREWKIQRIGWGIWLLTIIAALAGLTGSGPLSHAQARSNTDDLIVDYDRFARKGHQTQLTLHARENHPSTPIRLILSRSLLDQFRILRIEPEPISSETTDDGIAYSFANVGSADTKIVFRIEYDAIGPQRGHIGRSHDDLITIRQFIYP